MYSLLPVLPISVAGLLALWGAIELWILVRERQFEKAAAEDKYSRSVVMLAGALGIIGMLAAHTLLDPRPLMGVALSFYLGFMLVAAGILLRIFAVRHLGSHFSTRVSLDAEHQVIQHGVYAYVRHPAYTGILLGSVGIGLLLNHVTPFVVLFAPLATGISYRVRVEEAFLHAHLPAYAAYAARTKKFIPFIY